MYQIRTKGHYAQDWTNLSFVEDGFFSASNSTYTTVSYPIYSGSVWGDLRANDQVDFQVKAMIGYVHRTVGFMSWYFTGESSDWSPTQTIRIGEASTSDTPNPTTSSQTTTPTTIPTPTSTPIVPETNSNSITLPLDTSVIIIVVLGVIVTLSLLLYTKHRKTSNPNQ